MSIESSVNTNSNKYMTRLENEAMHGKYLATKPAEFWGWAGEVGKSRLRRRAKMLSHGLSGKVLEIGCGSGLFTTEIAKADFCLTAIDISSDLLALAKATVPLRENMEFKLEDAHKTSFIRESFDAIIGSSILHHLEVNLVFKEIFRLLKPGGIIRFTEPNYLNPQIAIERSHPFFRNLFHNSPDETAFFKWELRRELLSHGFSKISIENFDFLHPKTPNYLLPAMGKVTLLLEKLPGLKEISGSLFITAVK